MLRKYEFTSKTKYINTLKLLDFIPKHKPIVLGKIVLEKGEYDLEMKEIKAPVFSNKFCVDIYWNENEDTSVFNEFEVFPLNPKHKIA